MIVAGSRGVCAEALLLLVDLHRIVIGAAPTVLVIANRHLTELAQAPLAVVDRILLGILCVKLVIVVVIIVLTPAAPRVAARAVDSNRSCHTRSDVTDPLTDNLDSPNAEHHTSLHLRESCVSWFEVRRRTRRRKRLQPQMALAMAMNSHGWLPSPQSCSVKSSFAECVCFARRCLLRALVAMVCAQYIPFMSRLLTEPGSGTVSRVSSCECMQ